MSSEKEKLDDLSERIRQAEADTKPKPKSEVSPARDAGYDFAGLLGSVIIGVLLDRYFGTAPWCLVGMVVLGFVAGVVGLWRVLRADERKK